MAAYLADLTELRRSHPHDDLLTRLIQAEVDGEKLSADETLGFFQLLIIAGQETTSDLINNAVLTLLENPDQLARLRAHPELMPSAIGPPLRGTSAMDYAHGPP